MGFIGSDIYYALCAAALAVLILLLIGCQVKARRPPRKAPPPPSQEPSYHRPRYAAGGDMDRINRNAYTVEFENKHSDAPAIIGVVIISLLLLLMVPRFINALNQQFPAPSETVTPSAPVQTTPVGTIEMQIISADFNDDHSKLFVTYHYTNNSSRDFRYLVPTISLQDSDGNTVQTVIAETVDLVAQGETKEIISAVDIEPENQGKISNVTVHTTYRN